MLNIKKILAKILSWEGLKYTWDVNTNNTTDTWVPVFTGRKIQHAVLGSMARKSSVAVTDLPKLVQISSTTTAKFSLNANTGYYKDIPISVPSGYSLIGCVGVDSAHNQAGLIGGFRHINSTTIRVSGRNNTPSTNWTDMTLTVHALFVRNEIR